MPRDDGHPNGNHLGRDVAVRTPSDRGSVPGDCRPIAHGARRTAMPDVRHQVLVDHSEGRSALVDIMRRSGAFEIRMAHLATGDYLIANEVLIERKSVADLAASLVDGRLFPQVARLAHSSYRSLLLIEGSTSTSMPDVHPHSLEGALVSIAALGAFRCCMHPMRSNRCGCSASSPIK